MKTVSLDAIGRGESRSGRTGSGSAAKSPIRIEALRAIPRDMINLFQFQSNVAQSTLTSIARDSEFGTRTDDGDETMGQQVLPHSQ